MDVNRKRLPLFYVALGLALFHSQFFSPAVISTPAGLMWVKPFYDALPYLPAFAGYLFLLFGISWKADKPSRVLRLLLLAGTLCHIASYALLLLWDDGYMLLEIGCLLAPAALLLALRRWLKEQPYEAWEDGPNNAAASCVFLLALLALALVSCAMWIMQIPLTPTDASALPYPPLFVFLVRTSLRLGGLVYRLWPVGVVILLVSLRHPVQHAAKKED
ncbi:MAG: hypothetical protein IJN18_00070 [Clostridia bacterium]|nr:hypothetical protein [Clostridia bacterium]MBR6573493.1 hypothetical protein [Clostridia bacterium]